MRREPVLSASAWWLVQELPILTSAFCCCYRTSKPQEQHGSKMAFLDGAPPERLCQPMVDYFTAKGGELHMNQRLKNIELNDDGSVKQLNMVNGQTVSTSWQQETGNLPFEGVQHTIGN